MSRAVPPRHPAAGSVPSPRRGPLASALRAADIRQAVDRGELELHYQPQVAEDGRTAAMEALLRWHRPDGSRPAPDSFLPLAQHSGLMPRVTAYVLDRAVAQAARWRSRGIRVPVAVNVSPTDVLQFGFAEAVGECLSRQGLPGSALKLEITETIETPHVTEIAAVLDRLTPRGITISLDDFGTGHASLSRLRALPVGELKIDRTFVAGLADDPRDAAVVRYSIGLARELRLTVVAEGVETPPIRDLLFAMGVDLIQGWLVSPALPPEAATSWLIDPAASRSSPVRCDPPSADTR
ncbi:EAL domain-containing protein [Streptomyces vinaceus]|uniref:EAL domain-containing protein n=1 Tax=Streptomyces vinaceus TaxID=1960 RepID=UPI0038171C08